MRPGLNFLPAIFALLASGGHVQRLSGNRIGWARRREVWSQEAHDAKVAAAEAKRQRKGMLRLRNHVRSIAGYHPALQRSSGACRG